MIRPTTTGRGMAVAGAEKDTPETNTTPSIPSLLTVMKDSRKREYFIVKRLNLPAALVDGVGASRALASFKRHFSCIFPMRSRAAPTTVIMRPATR